MDRLNKHKKIIAFTLAEVLVALSIIGTIFLISLSTVHSTTTERQRQSQLMKLFPVMDNIINLVILRQMGIDNVPFGLDEKSANDKFAQLLIPYLNVGENCQTSATTCWNKTEEMPTDSGFTDGLPGSSFHKLKLVDGTAIAIQTYDTDTSVTVDDNTFEKTRILMYVDINSDDPPNKWGEDVFAFVYTSQTEKDVSGKLIHDAGFQPASTEAIKIVSKPKESVGHT